MKRVSLFLLAAIFAIAFVACEGGNTTKTTTEDNATEQVVDEATDDTVDEATENTVDEAEVEESTEGKCGEGKCGEGKCGGEETEEEGC